MINCKILNLSYEKIISHEKMHGVHVACGVRLVVISVTSQLERKVWFGICQLTFCVWRLYVLSVPACSPLRFCFLTKSKTFQLVNWELSLSVSVPSFQGVPLFCQMATEKLFSLFYLL